MPAKRPLAVSSSRINIEEDEEELLTIKVINFTAI
jgi:hypothetical protein